MKKILSLLAGMALVLAAGLAYAEDIMPGSGDLGDKVIRNEDLSHIQLDQDRATLNQMPSEAEGSAAGGMSTDSGTDMEMDQGKTPIDKGAAKPDAEGQGAGGAGKDSDTWQKDMKTGDSPVDKGVEGPDTGGKGEESPAKDSGTYKY